MGRFWEAATEQAGREFGARHYRWFAGARLAKRIVPVLAVLVVLAAIVAAAFFGVRWTAGHWDTITGTAGDWAGSAAGAAGPVLLWALIAAAALGVVAVTAIFIVRNRWRFSFRVPYWLRRY